MAQELESSSLILTNIDCYHPLSYRRGKCDLSPTTGKTNTSADVLAVENGYCSSSAVQLGKG
jgi:hypothetical protein